MAAENVSGLLLWPVGELFSHQARVELTRAWEPLQARILEAVGDVENQIDELRAALDVIANELRRPEPARGALRIACAFLGALLTAVLANAVWEQIRDPFQEFVTTYLH